MKNRFYTLNQVLQFKRKFTFLTGERMTGLSYYLLTHVVYSDTDAIYIRRKDFNQNEK